MRICASCHAEVEDDSALFCPRCGKRMDGKKICANCGSLIPEGNRFCPDCGKDPTVKEVVKTQYVPTYYYRPKPLQGHLTGCLLVLFLSFLGIIVAQIWGDWDCREGAKWAGIVLIAAYGLALAIVLLSLHFTGLL